MTENVKTKKITSKNLIYAYVDPLTFEVKYVGKSTSGLLRARSFSGHKHGKVGVWIEALAKDNLKPLITILEELTEAATDDILNKAEQKHIDNYPNLLNVAPAGAGTRREQPPSVFETELKSFLKLVKSEKMVVTSVTFSNGSITGANLIPDFTEVIKQTEPDLPDLSKLPKSFDEIPVNPGMGALQNWNNPNELAEGTLKHEDLMARQRGADADALGWDLLKYTS